ncbi:hypothetical protein LSH36_1247g00011 [Paralvinella palmiformis]|uniref:Uncharacterized protein n=1 Tax=Paralvinella palmiformis TaxID=53620 RepID=A0AAD9IUG8_9ANNE|nr:hypothetical protein LSH36_1247g00011 [Paralvinella palmiformis]
MERVVEVLVEFGGSRASNFAISPSFPKFNSKQEPQSIRKRDSVIPMFSMIFSVLSVSKSTTPATTNMCTKSNMKCGTKSTTYMVPSSIYHIYSGTNCLLTAGTDQNILDVSRKIAESGQLPKLQVVEKDGCWFTLNNAQLDLCRILERDGKCTKVKVDIVPLSTIPRVVRGMMRVPTDNNKIVMDEATQPERKWSTSVEKKGREKS